MDRPLFLSRMVGTSYLSKDQVEDRHLPFTIKTLHVIDSNNGERVSTESCPEIIIPRSFWADTPYILVVYIVH